MQGSVAAARITPGGIIAGKYRLIRSLGEGAMGVVWSATNQTTNREVAIKLLASPEPELRRRLLREARACGALRHRNIVDIYDVNETDTGEPFLVMELLSGRTLADLLDHRRRLEAPLAARIAREIAAALTAAHAARIIHRDLKPSNIFLHEPFERGDFVVKVLDFGVAKDLAALDSHATATGGAVGSPSYMSPEQARGLRDVDPRSDIWSLGVVLFEMVAGVRPFQGAGAAVIAAILTSEIPRLSQAVWRADARLVDVVDRCLRRNREERFQSAEEVARILEAVAHNTATAGVAAETRQASQPPWSGGAEVQGDTAPLPAAAVAAVAAPRMTPGDTLQFPRPTSQASSGAPPQAQPGSVTSTAPLVQVQPTSARPALPNGGASSAAAPPGEAHWTRRTVAFFAALLLASGVLGVVAVKIFLPQRSSIPATANAAAPESLASPPPSPAARPASADPSAAPTPADPTPAASPPDSASPESLEPPPAAAAALSPSPAPAPAPAPERSQPTSARPGGASSAARQPSPAQKPSRPAPAAKPASPSRPPPPAPSPPATAPPRPRPF